MIRRAVHDDYEAMIPLGRAMVIEGWPHAPIDEDKVRQVFDAIVSNGYACVSVTDGEIDGLLLGMIDQLWFSQALCAHDYAFYVSPAARGGMAAPRLVADFVKWGRAHAVAEIQISVSSGVQVEASRRLLEGFGFEFSGGIFKLKVA